MARNLPILLILIEIGGADSQAEVDFTPVSRDRRRKAAWYGAWRMRSPLDPEFCRRRSEQGREWAERHGKNRCLR